MHTTSLGHTNLRVLASPGTVPMPERRAVPLCKPHARNGPGSAGKAGIRAPGRPESPPSRRGQSALNSGAEQRGGAQPAPRRQGEATAADGANKPLRRRGPGAVTIAAVEGGRLEARAAGGTRGRQRRAPARVSCAGAVGGGGATPRSPTPRDTGPAPSRRRFFGGSALPRPPNPSAAFPPFRV